jgi:hypothetical protein
VHYTVVSTVGLLQSLGGGFAFVIPLVIVLILGDFCDCDIAPLKWQGENFTTVLSVSRDLTPFYAAPKRTGLLKTVMPKRGPTTLVFL